MEPPRTSRVTIDVSDHGAGAGVDTRSRWSVRRLGQRSLGSLAYEELRDALMRREFVPGQKLELPRLGQMLGISATPLKEAIRLLADQGLLEVRSQHGTFVRPITGDALTHAAEARLVIESWALRKIRTPGGADYDHLREVEELLVKGERIANDRCGDAVTLETRFVPVDRAFHRGLVEVAGNPSMVRLHDLLGTHFLLARAWCIETAEQTFTRIQEGVGEHRSMYEALTAGRSDDAVSIAASHIHRSLDRAVQIVRENGGAI